MRLKVFGRCGKNQNYKKSTIPKHIADIIRRIRTFSSILLVFFTYGITWVGKIKNQRMIFSLETYLFPFQNIMFDNACVMNDTKTPPLVEKNIHEDS